MSERDAYEPGVPCWVDTLQPDPEAAKGFYGKLFGWEFAGPGLMPGSPPGRYFVARLRGRDVAGVGSRPVDGGPGTRTWNTYVCVASAEDAAQKVKRAGGTVLAAPMDVLPAGRMSVLADPAGASFCAWEPRARKGAQLVNEPGAWAMSMLDTRDLERSAAFYGAVFGWTTERFELRDGSITMFRLPGYVGGEPEQPVSREVVAAMALARDAAPPRWSVDFWVHDVDAVATNAAALGGRIVVAPFSTPVGRTAVLADPHGVSFSVSKVRARR
ncbi:MAG TPA: VOC family protein [Anaeromyxobacter sp.]